jgi:hypothetical protein
MGHVCSLTPLLYSQFKWYLLSINFCVGLIRLFGSSAPAAIVCRGAVAGVSDQPHLRRYDGGRGREQLLAAQCHDLPKYVTGAKKNRPSFLTLDLRNRPPDAVDWGGVISHKREGSRRSMINDKSSGHVGRTREKDRSDAMRASCPRSGEESAVTLLGTRALGLSRWLVRILIFLPRVSVAEEEQPEGVFCNWAWRLQVSGTSPGQTASARLRDAVEHFN